MEGIIYILTLKLKYVKISHLNSNMKETKISFASSTFITMIANLFVASCNYIIIYYVAKTVFDIYPTWLATVGLLGTLGTLGNGLFLNLIRKIGLISDKSLIEKVNFGIKYEKKVLGYWLWIILLIPTFGILSLFIIPNVNIYFGFILSSYIFTNFYFGLRQNTMLGSLMIKEYAIANSFSTFLRLVSTIGFISIGIGIWSLPLGLIINVISYHLISKFFTHKYYKPNIEKFTDTDIKQNLNNTKKIILTTVYLFLLSSLLNLPTIFILNKDLFSILEISQFALIYTFGQIIHFASISGLDSLIAYTANKNTIKYYFKALKVASCITIIIGLCIIIFKELVLISIGRSNLLDNNYHLLIYFFCILLYNSIYISTMYLIAKNKFKLILSLGISILLFTLANSFKVYNQFSNDTLGVFLITIAILSLFNFIWLFLSILNSSKTNSEL
jgi:hypothetical protein